jgi:hypothetical protein
MAEGQGQHTDTQLRHGTGASRAGNARRFLDAATLRHTMAPSHKTLVAQGLVCLMSFVRARSMPGWTA